MIECNTSEFLNLIKGKPRPTDVDDLCNLILSKSLDKVWIDSLKDDIVQVRNSHT